MDGDAATSAEPSSLVGFALRVLSTPDAFAKAALTRRALAAWRSGALPPWLPCDGAPADKPRRDAALQVVAPGFAPKRGRGGTLESRCAMLHSLVHTESWAVDLSWDLLARFARQLPGDEARAFCDDWAVVAEDEARHFEALAERLNALGGRYGALAVHDGCVALLPCAKSCSPERSSQALGERGANGAQPGGAAGGGALHARGARAGRAAADDIALPRRRRRRVCNAPGGCDTAGGGQPLRQGSRLVPQAGGARRPGGR